MLDAKAREALEGVSRAMGGALGRLGLTPNALTVTGLVATAVAAWLVIEQAFLAAGLVLAFGGALDFLDGSVARATGRATKFGAFLDSVTDRVSDTLILLAITWAFFARADDLAAALALVAVGLGALVPYLRAKAESLDLDCRVGIAERAERTLAIIVGLVFDVMVWVLAILVVASAITAVQRLVHVHRQIRDSG